MSNNRWMDEDVKYMHNKIFSDKKILHLSCHDEPDKALRKMKC